MFEDNHCLKENYKENLFLVLFKSEQKYFVGDQKKKNCIMIYIKCINWDDHIFSLKI